MDLSGGKRSTTSSDALGSSAARAAQAKMQMVTHAHLTPNKCFDMAHSSFDVALAIQYNAAQGLRLAVVIWPVLPFGTAAGRQHAGL
jgi:hypothetical protein